MPENNERPKLKEIGALWQHEKNGAVYYSGKLEDGRRVLVFANKYREEDEKKPHFKIYEAPDREMPK